MTLVTGHILNITHLLNELFHTLDNMLVELKEKQREKRNTK